MAMVVNKHSSTHGNGNSARRNSPLNFLDNKLAFKWYGRGNAAARTGRYNTPDQAIKFIGKDEHYTQAEALEGRKYAKAFVEGFNDAIGLKTPFSLLGKKVNPRRKPNVDKTKSKKTTTKKGTAKSNGRGDIIQEFTDVDGIKGFNLDDSEAQYYWSLDPNQRIAYCRAYFAQRGKRMPTLPAYLQPYAQSQSKGGSVGPSTSKSKSITDRIMRALKGRSNPAPLSGAAADSTYAMFHGRAPSGQLEISDTTYYRTHWAELGVLTKLVAKTPSNYQLALEFDPDEYDTDVIRVVCNPEHTQIGFEGGDQSIDLDQLGMGQSTAFYRDLVDLGPCTLVQYRTRKGFDKFELIDYFHKLGEDTKVRPHLIYDTLNNRLSLAGGEYTIEDRGIVN